MGRNAAERPRKYKLVTPEPFAAAEFTRINGAAGGGWGRSLLSPPSITSGQHNHLALAIPPPALAQALKLDNLRKPSFFLPSTKQHIIPPQRNASVHMQTHTYIRAQGHRHIQILTHTETSMRLKDIAAHQHLEGKTSFTKAKTRMQN